MLDIIQRNPFRIVGVYATAARKEIVANITRIKANLRENNQVDFVETGSINKWLVEQFGKDPVTISKWYTNAIQPDLQSLSEMSSDLHG